MKKLLALILSVIMVLSIMPIAYAQRATYSPEIEEYIENYIRVYSYLWSHYETSDQKTEVQKIIVEAIDGKTQVTVEYEDDMPKRIETILLSTQHIENKEIEELRSEIIKNVINEYRA